MRLTIIIHLLAFISIFECGAQSRTRVVLLGTGTPNIDPTRSGPSTAIIVDGIPYIVDCGPGVVHRAKEAGIDLRLLNKLFITHLHSDHTAGYADFILTPAVLERFGPVKVFGPKGTENLNRHTLLAFSEDILMRTNGPEHGDSICYKINAKDISEGVIYKDNLVEVISFKVKHGTWPEAFGYKFITPDKTIVLSGDCTYSESVIHACNGCDILIHEVYSEEGFSKRPEKWKKYHSAFHSSTSQVAQVAKQCEPKQLILTHALLWNSSEEELINEVCSKYGGRVILGKDLGTY